MASADGFSLQKNREIVAARASPGEIPGHQLLGRQIQSHRTVHVRQSDDKKVPYISGCVFMPNGNFVTCDVFNNNIKLFEFVVTP